MLLLIEMTNNKYFERYFSFVGYIKCKPLNVQWPTAPADYEIGYGDSEWGISLWRYKNLILIESAHWVPSNGNPGNYGEWDRYYYVGFLKDVQLFAACPVNYEDEVAEALGMGRDN